MNYMERAKLLFQKGRLPSTPIPVGSTEREIDDLEKSLERKLAKAHREFLLWMGADARAVFAGSDIEIDQILGLDSDLKYLLEEYEAEDPDERPRCVFFQHQGYQFLYYLTPAADDPLVYVIQEAADTPGLENKPLVHFSTFIEDSVIASLGIARGIYDYDERSSFFGITRT